MLKFNNETIDRWVRVKYKKNVKINNPQII